MFRSSDIIEPIMEAICDNSIAATTGTVYYDSLESDIIGAEVQIEETQQIDDLSSNLMSLSPLTAEENIIMLEVVNRVEETPAGCFPLSSESSEDSESESVESIESKEEFKKTCFFRPSQSRTLVERIDSDANLMRCPR